MNCGAASHVSPGSPGRSATAASTRRSTGFPRRGCWSGAPHRVAGPARYVLSLTEAGHAEMLDRLREPADHEITDFTRFLTILAFLSRLPSVADQHAVLRRLSGVPGTAA